MGSNNKKRWKGKCAVISKLIVTAIIQQLLSSYVIRKINIHKRNANKNCILVVLNKRYLLLFFCMIACILRNIPSANLIQSPLMWFVKIWNVQTFYRWNNYIDHCHHCEFKWKPIHKARLVLLSSYTLCIDGRIFW